MIAIALADGPTSRLLFCGYEYVSMPLPGETAEQRRQGRPQWVRMNLVRGVWVGDLTQRHPVAFSTVETAQQVLDELHATHNDSAADRLILVNATTGTPIETTTP